MAAPTPTFTVARATAEPWAACTVKVTGAVTGVAGSESAPALVRANPAGRVVVEDQEIAAPRLSVAPNWMASAVGTCTAVDPTTDVADVPNVAVMALMLSEYALVAVTV